MHRFYMVGAAWLVAVMCFGQNNEGDTFLEFQHLNEGLSQNRVTCILQDHLGYIWVGTYAGLNRYDGVSFEIFENIRNDTTSLPDSYVLSLFEDSKHNLWVGTSSGLARFNRESHAFDRVGSLTDRVDNPYAQVVNALIEDGQGRILLGTTGGLYRMDNEGVVQKLEVDLQYYEIRAFLLEEDRLWVGTSNGLDLLAEDDQVFPAADELGIPISVGRVTDIAKVDGEYWVSTQGNGVFRLKGAGPSFQWNHFLHDPDDSRTIGNDRVQTMLADRKGNLWLGTENGGLDLYDPYATSFTHFIGDPTKPGSLNSNSIWDLIEDREGRLWVGTFNQGIELFDPYFRKFQSVKVGLSHNVVSAMVEHDGKLWVGTDGGGINIWKDQEVHGVINASNSNLTSDAILAFHKDSFGALWVGTWAGGLYRFDRAANDFEQWYPEEWNLESLYSPNIFAIDEDADGNLWVAALDGGVHRWDRAKDTFFGLSARGGDGLTSDVVISLTVDDQDNVWVGTESGLNRIVFRSMGDFEVRQFTKDSEALEALQSNVINQIFQAPNGSIWIATGAGLSLYDEESMSFTTYDKLNGLPNSVIKGIVDDGGNGLWISTNDGVSHMTFKDDQAFFENYNANDGLQGKEFSRGVTYKSGDGTIYLGGSNGFSFFDPSSLTTNPHAPSVVLSDFKLFNREVKIGAEGSPLQRHISTLDEIQLERSQNVFSIGFTALNLTHADRNRYSYMLEGFEDQWNEAEGARSATYTNLAAGQYTFRVRASNNDGVWNDEGRSLRITVLPYWWETGWFRVAALVAITSIVVLANRYRRASTRASKQLLEEKIKQATTEIEEKSMELERQRDSLEAAVMDTDFVIREAVDSGNFSARVQVEGKEGEWKKLGTSINQLFDSVLVPLQAVKSLMKEMALGNLTSRYTAEAKGDILDLANNVNQAISSLAALLGQVSVEVSNMTFVSDQMSQSSEEMASTTAQISRAIEEINSGAANQLRMIDEAHNLLTDIVSSADSVNRKAFNINQTASQGTDLSVEGSKLMDELAESMQKAMYSSTKTTEATEILSNRSQEISSIVRIMKEIAAQTNLLALNAAIEAAQAGDAGRGFAVVAEEIRKLAEGSKKSANEIQQLIVSIQEDTGRTAELIGEMGEDIQSGESTTKKAAISFQEISSYYQKSFEASTDILNTAQKQSTDIENVVSLIQNLVTVAEQTAAGSGEVNESTELMLMAMESVRDQSQMMLTALRGMQQQVGEFDLGNGEQAQPASALNHS